MPAPAGALLELRKITYGYPGMEPVLKGVDLRLEPGDRVLIAGGSGAGKSTFAAVMAGLRDPKGGLCLLGGLDRGSLGNREWRRQVVLTPQFHENHIITETLAFNLLLGHSWPPDPLRMQVAEEVCRSLGLGPLLEQMPGGMMQMVGEGGWKLSHGEQGRVMLARALLQGAQVVVLDESFAALDPETLQTCLEAVLQRAPTLVVIAHP
jgi:ATP-binding cassette subfamily B protein